MDNRLGLMPAAVVLYGCGPIDRPLLDPYPFIPPDPPPVDAIDLSKFMKPTLVPCATCNRHIVTGTLCPWCTPPATKPTPEVEKLRAALKKELDYLEVEKRWHTELLQNVEERIAEVKRDLGEP